MKFLRILSLSRRLISTVNKGDLVISKPKELLAKEFPDYYSDGKFKSRISYVDFIDQALEKFKDLGLERNLEAYKELLRIFPPGKYHRRSNWDVGLFNAPQQVCAIRLLQKMEFNKVQPDAELQRLVVQAFGKTSSVWLKVARMNYWSRKARNWDPNPIPEVLPEETDKLAQIAIKRMLIDARSKVTAVNTHSLPDAIDKTWIVSSQSSTQISMIQKLDKKSILHIEEGGLAYVDTKSLTYYVLKYYIDPKEAEAKIAEPKPDYNFNTLEMKFFGKPIRDKIAEPEENHFVDDGYILAIGITGTSSHDSILSWLKLLQKNNPKLSELSVLFKLNRPTPEIINLSTAPKPC